MNIRINLTVALFLLCSVTVAAKDSIPLNAVNRAGEVIDAAIEAYGGSERLAGIKTVLRESDFKTWATNQSLTPGPPWDQSVQKNFAAVDFENKIFIGRQEGSQGGFEFKTAQIIKGEQGWNLDYRSGTVTDQPSPDFNNAAGPLIRVTAPLLVKQLQERRHTSYWLGEVKLDGRPHDIITLVMEAGPALSLYFDRDSHMLSRSERVLPPFGQVDYRFAQYHKIDGIPFAASFQLFVNDEPNLDIKYSRTMVNQNLEPYAEISDTLKALEGVAQPTEVELAEIAPGVYLIGAAGTYALFVEMDDHILAVGGTAGVPERIKKLRDSGQNKPIKYAVLTHHHNDHLLAVPAWDEEGAVLFTVKANEKVVREQASDGSVLDLQFIKDKHVFEGGQRVEIHNIGPTPHAQDLLVAYLPEHGLLFEADHFPNPLNGQIIPAQPVTVRLAAVIDELGLKVTHIVGAHSSRVATIDDLRQSLASKAK